LQKLAENYCIEAGTGRTYFSNCEGRDLIEYTLWIISNEFVRG